MANFWNRGKDNVTEAQEYLRSTDNVSRPMALLLSLLGFLVVFAFVFSLFLGGRWLFQRLSGDDASTEEVAIQVGEGSTEDSAPLVTVDDSSNDGVDVTVGQTPAPSVSSPQTTVNGPSSSTDTPSAADVDSLPRTGPADTALMLVAVTVIAGASHNVYARRR